MVVVDSSVLIDLMARKVNPRTAWLRQRRYAERFAITTLIYCEALRGLRYDSQLIPTQQFLSQFEIFETGSKDIALASALNYRLLRSRGITVRNTIDCIIATFCIQQGHTLLHSDRDFDGFETHLGLLVLHPPDFLVH